MAPGPSPTTRTRWTSPPEAVRKERMESSRHIDPHPPSRPRRLLYLADCYLPDSLWPPFHRNTMTTMAGAFDEVLAIRTNVYFEDRSHRPRSADHLHHFCQIVRNYAPDVVFSINRCGVPPEVVAAAGPARVVTLFIDYFERFGPELHE